MLPCDPLREEEIREILNKYDAVPDGRDEKDEYCMRCALELAELAAAHDETPVGCVILRDGMLITGDFNGRETLKNGLYHAEVGAISKACELLGGWRLTRCTLYVTIEPCPMCAGAIWAARIPRVVTGARDPKAGFYGSVADLNTFDINHKPEIRTEVLEEECSNLVSSFFRNKRKQKSAKNPPNDGKGNIS
jgi:tRNA(adenine34) deaminase